MKLCLITPVAHVGLTGLLPGRFCIGPVAAEHATYREYFKQSACEGLDVILDNGAFEQQTLSDDDLIALALDIRPKTLVIPDLINAPSNVNWIRAQKFIDKWCKVLRQDVTAEKIELMFVPQCQDGEYEEYMNDFDVVLYHPLVKWFGVCPDGVENAFSKITGTRETETNRLAFVWDAMSRGLPQRCQLRNTKKFHFLGVDENISYLKHYWFAESQDTASFFWKSVVGGDKRPVDYFTHDYTEELNHGALLELKYCCDSAKQVASEADDLRSSGHGRT